MKQAPDIRFIGMEPSDALTSSARERIAKLEQFCDAIIGCHVAFEMPHKHQRQGRSFAVRLELTMPGRKLAVNRVENEDAYVALRDAFDDLKRQLEAVLGRIQDQEQRQPASAAGAGVIDTGSAT
jgi:ribosomal subunit interface protein